MINSWIIYLRLSSCRYVNKMIIGSSYGIVHRLRFFCSSSFWSSSHSPANVFRSCSTCTISVSMNIFQWSILNCILLSAYIIFEKKKSDDRSKDWIECPVWRSFVCFNFEFSFFLLFTFLQLHPIVVSAEVKIKKKKTKRKSQSCFVDRGA